jgi:uncharacterized protein YggE
MIRRPAGDIWQEILAMRIAAALMLAMIVGVAYAQTAPVREASITVAGEGRANIAPDFAEFFADVVTRAESLEAATRQHTERAAKAVAVLRGMAKHSVSVESSSFRLEQNRAPRPAAGQKQSPLEYRAITTFALKVNQLASLNEAVSSIATAGLFEVRTIRYGIKDEERAIDDARRAAVKNARRQAEVYADAAGVKLGEILEIFDGLAQNLGSEAALRQATPNVQVSPPATIPFRAAINIKWRIISQP